jgi:hypothetical protein
MATQDGAPDGISDDVAGSDTPGAKIRAIGRAIILFGRNTEARGDFVDASVGQDLRLEIANLANEWLELSRILADGSLVLDRLPE